MKIHGEELEIFVKEFPEDRNDIAITEFSVTYMQESEIKDDFDSLKLSIDSQGGGYYFVMETKRWAFDKIDDLIKVLNDFKNKTKI